MKNRKDRKKRKEKRKVRINRGKEREGGARGLGLYIKWEAGKVAGCSCFYIWTPLQVASTFGHSFQFTAVYLIVFTS